MGRTMRRSLRGDHIPPVSDYAHYNEEAELMWYAENRYDMEHWDEEVDDLDEDMFEWDDDPTLFLDDFNVFEEQQVFLDNEGEYDLDQPEPHYEVDRDAE